MWLEPQRVVQTPAVRQTYRSSKCRATAAVSLLAKTLYARRNGDTGRDMGLLGFDNFADAFDGGGAGTSGDTFSGGPLSELLNALGIRPHGFGQRQMGERPMPNPAYSAPRMSTSGGPAPSYGYVASPPYNPLAASSAITQTALPPQGAMPNEQLIAMLMQALNAPPSPYGYGPR